MKECIIDGGKIKSVEMFHTFMQEALQLPDFYGRNLDALYDCLTGFVECPLTIRWIHFSISEVYLGEMGHAIIETIKDAVEMKQGLYLIIEK